MSLAIAKYGGIGYVSRLTKLNRDYCTSDNDDNTRDTDQETGREDIPTIPQGINATERIPAGEELSTKHRGIEYVDIDSGSTTDTLKTLVPGADNGRTNRPHQTDGDHTGPDTDVPKEDRLPSILRDISTIKRILAGEGLSAKHGGSGADDRAELVQALFYYPIRAGITTRERAEEILIGMCGLPGKEVSTLLDVIWGDPPRNINDTLKDIAPSYMMTRRGAALPLLDQWTEDNPTITSYFLGEVE